MSRRIASRDDLFLSALDLYTLLSLAFIGFAFFVRPASGVGTVELPIAQSGDDGAPGSQRLAVRWVPGSAPKDATVSPTAECQVLVVREAEEMSERDSKYTVPCVPVAFGGGGLNATGAGRLNAPAEQPRREVLILCSPDDGLLACASLQWVMHEAGFRPLAGVLIQQKGATR